MKKLLIFILKIYQNFVSSCLPVHCKFYPTCSTYAINVIEKQGIMRGLWLAIWRILRCNPWNKGGYDPVP